jgi:hypothetical protein
MALYKRWIDLKNGKITREFKRVGDEDFEQPEETPEDFDVE